jgi:hypothetical protein
MGETPIPTEIDDRWVGLATLHLDRGFLQVLADRGGERRAFAVYDSTGVLRRVTLVDAFIGFLDSDPASRRLLALRRTDRVELVVYEWAWGSH